MDNLIKGSRVEIGDKRYVVYEEPEKSAETVKEAEPVYVVENTNHLEEAFTAAREEGYAQGYEEGVSAVVSVAGKIVRDAAESLKDAVSGLYRDAEMKYEQNVIRISVEIAKKILGTAISCDHEALGSLFRDAIEKTISEEYEILRVRLSRESVAIYKDMLEMSLGILVTPDGKLGDTRCIIETASCEIEAGLDMQLSQIEKALLGET